MKIVFKMFLTVVVMASFTGCYNDFEDPTPSRIYTDEDFASDKIISIKELKDLFYATYPGTSGIGKPLTITDDYVIRGKVISSDRAGNVYKSLYIFDNDPNGPSAIEIKLTTGNYIFYPVGRIVYIKLKGLVLGNYRSMLSVGLASSNPQYANDNIEDRITIDQHVFKGAQLNMIKADTIVVNPSTYNTLTDDDLGRLVRFEGVKSKFGKAGWGYKNTFPNYFANSNSYDVNSPDIDNPDIPEDQQWKNINEWATYACVRYLPTSGSAYTKTFFFGSGWFTYGNIDQLPGNYVVRSSGYCRFRDVELPKDGQEVDITALFTLFSPGNPSQSAYQLILNDGGDVKLKGLQ